MKRCEKQSISSQSISTEIEMSQSERTSATLASMMHGFINLNKPSGWTSHDCVAKLRRLLNTKKVGHSGTLDPLATGVLPIAVGKATRLLQYLPEGKAYQAVIRFGVQTTTDDLAGEIIRQTSAADLQRSQVEACFSQFVGELTQVPPMYSAVQVNGKRLYDLARQGKTVDIPTRQVVIKQLHSRQWQSGEQPELTVDVLCGPGTYIRSLARDLGEAIGMGATLAKLTRTYSNGFSLENSLSIETLTQALSTGDFVPLSAGEMLQHLSAIALPPALSRRWCLGQKLSLEESKPHLIYGHNDHDLTSIDHPLIGQPLRVLAADSQTFLGIGEFRVGVPTAQSHDASSADAAQATTIFAPKRVYATI